ncbi:MPT63 family protein [Mycobacterium sp.]|uniref:MPT63 family protein n=1 Tax=Mycobacterium sp. TaxID=1785 RepID=UPI003C756F9A
MKFTSTTVKSAIGATGIAAASIFAAATAVAAPPTMGGFGTSEQLVDGPLITNYTVSNLQPANVTIPGYTPQGQVYQANVTAQANSGAVTPVVSDFNARAASGQQYRVIDTIPVPNGLSPAPILQGNQSTGTLYFDVTGAQPNQVVYNDGTQDVLLWTA